MATHGGVAVNRHTYVCRQMFDYIPLVYFLHNNAVTSIVVVNC